MLKIINSVSTTLTFALLLLSVGALAQPTLPLNDRKDIGQESQSSSSSTNGEQTNPTLVDPKNSSDVRTPHSTVHPSSPVGINPSNPAGVDQSSPTGGTGGSSGYQ